MGTWREIEHTADRALYLQAESLSDLLETAARGLYSLLTGSEATETESEVSFRLIAPDMEALLVDWLNELLYYFDVHRLAFSRFRFDALLPTEVSVTAGGGQRAEVQTPIKAATFHNLMVRHSAAGYETTVVFDV